MVSRPYLNMSANDDGGLSSRYQPVVTEVNFQDAAAGESVGISQAAGMFIMNQSMVKPGQRKFTKDNDGYDQPLVTVTFEGERSSQHVPTPIPSGMTFRDDDKMNSRESTNNENSATMPIMDNESDEGFSSASDGGGGGIKQLNSIQINI